MTCATKLHWEAAASAISMSSRFGVTSRDCLGNNGATRRERGEARDTDGDPEADADGSSRRAGRTGVLVQGA